MSRIAIKVNNITKVYKLYNKPIDRLKESFSPFKKEYHKKFTALNNVSFELRRGESLGVIGKNGQGKSTLMKIIAGIMPPTSGNVKTEGRIAAVLEVSSGLKVEMTGVENINLNLRINGFKGDKLKEKRKEIIEFVDLGDFINQPVKLYSSGMKSRLGFGISTSVEPDVLILDEVLAVGDFVFRQKCLAKLNGMRKNISIIFVSHSMSDIRIFCNRAIVLKKGRIVYSGQPEDCIAYYMEKDVVSNKKEAVSDEKKKIASNVTDLVYNNKDKIENVELNWLDENKIKQDTFFTGDNTYINIKFKLNYKPDNLIIGIPIYNEKNEVIAAIGSDFDSHKLPASVDGSYDILVEIPFLNLNPGQYCTVVSIVDYEFLYRSVAYKMIVNCRARYFGNFTFNAKWRNNYVSNKAK